MRGTRGQVRPRHHQYITVISAQKDHAYIYTHFAVSWNIAYLVHTLGDFGLIEDFGNVPLRPEMWAMLETKSWRLTFPDTKYFSTLWPEKHVGVRRDDIAFGCKYRSVCVFFTLSRFFLPVDIQHNQCPWRFFNPRTCTSYVVTKLRHSRDTTLPRTWYAVSTAVRNEYAMSLH